ncbi:MAG: PEP-CTERM sorting domain-containing protein [Alteromonadales bacterium]|nr:PEP-CTERM sorting domain-containing protein [Alteromonadales bacterium]
MLKRLSKSLFSISFLLSSSIVSASLITNGSFETLTFDNNSTTLGIVKSTNLKSFKNKKRAWDVFYALPGWVTTAGNGIELQKNVVTKSAEGKNHVELDSHPRSSSNSAMTQSLDSLIIGADYLLEFSYKPRTNLVNDNGINVFWYDTAVKFDINMEEYFSINSTSKKQPDWAVQSIVLTAQSETMDLSFGAFGKQNTLGGLLDNISLVQMNSGPTNNVPEPSTLALSVLGFGLLVRRRYKIANKVTLKVVN